MFDVIIAGAGPAGSSAARQAAKSGLKALLIDKDDFPRHKPCGGALSEQVFDQLDFEVPGSIIRREFSGGLMCYDHIEIDVQLPYRIGVLVKRSDFDNLLFEKAREAGCETRTNEKVLSCRLDGGNVTVVTSKGEYRGRFLIVAEGATGKLKRAVRPSDSKKHFFICICADIPAEEGAARPQMPLVLDFGLPRMGYGWIFPRETDASVGMGDLADYVDDLRSKMDDFLRRHGVTPPERYEGHTIPLGGIERKVAAPSILLVGDAAGYADTLLGEGIAYAILTGRLAASTIAEALDAGDPEAVPAMYTERCEAALGSEMRNSLYLARALSAIPRRLFRAVVGHEPTLRRYLDILACKNTYARFNRQTLARLPFYLLRMLWS